MANLVSPERDVRWLGARLRHQRSELAARWLQRLDAMLVVERRETVPMDRLGEHIPDLIVHFGDLLDQQASPIIDPQIIARAAELGRQRYVQRAGVQQLLAEYQVLIAVVEQFVEDEIAGAEPVDALALLRAMRRIRDAAGVLCQESVSAFFADYTHTIERQTEQLRKFSRLVSHEIRQPLAVLQVIVRTLPVADGDVEAARMMDIFSRNVDRLSDVTGGLERLARITPATDMSLREHETDLGGIAHAAARQVREMAEAHGVQILIAPNLPTVRVDAARAELVFVNLLANAIKYSDPAKSQRYVEVQPAEADRASVLVRDNGIGIAAARLQHIFREFVRAHAQRHDEIAPRGLGLGLAIVRECMDTANGSVRVESVAGKGTTFKLTWPPR